MTCHGHRRHLHPIDGNVLHGPLRFGGRDLDVFWEETPGLFRLVESGRFSEKPGFSTIFGMFPGEVLVM